MAIPLCTICLKFLETEFLIPFSKHVEFIVVTNVVHIGRYKRRYHVPKLRWYYYFAGAEAQI